MSPTPIIDRASIAWTKQRLRIIAGVAEEPMQRAADGIRTGFHWNSDHGRRLGIHAFLRRGRRGRQLGYRAFSAETEFKKGEIAERALAHPATDRAEPTR